MTLANPEYLFLLLLFFILYGWARRPRQWVIQPSRLQVRRANLFSRLTLAVPLLCWLGASSLLVVALANPQKHWIQSFVTVEETVFVMCIDLSTSMGHGEGSTMEKVRALSLDFMRKRKGDAIGIAAYSGAIGRSRGPGYARILSYPTQNTEHAEDIINSLTSKMFGAYTAIGDGLFMSILALTQQEAKEKLGPRYDRRLLEASIDSLGTDKEDLAYAQEVAKVLGPQKGKHIILFTDGTFNTGMHPAKPLWFAKKLGIKTYFISFAISGPTGLTPDEIVQNKKELVEAVIDSGGVYRESDDFEEIKKIYNEIHRAQKARFKVAEEPREDNNQDELFAIAAGLFALGIITAAVWIKIP